MSYITNLTKGVLRLNRTSHGLTYKSLALLTETMTTALTKIGTRMLLALFTTLLLFIILPMAFSLRAVASTTPEIIDSATYNGHTYYLLSSDTWTNSEAFAQTLGGHLVTIKDDAENDFVYNTFTNNGTINRGLWVGLKRAFPGVNTFVWTNGEPVCYARFYFTEPNNLGGNENYVHIFYPGDFRATYWNDAPDSSAPFGVPFHGVVEIGPSDPNPIRIIESATYNGHTYHLLSPCSWSASENFAQMLGGHLVTINDRAEDDFVYNTFTHNRTVDRSLWIGLKRSAPGVDERFVWADDEPVCGADFASQQPDDSQGIEDYVLMWNPSDRRAPQWADVTDWSPINGVVEIGPPEPNPITILESATYNGHTYYLISSCSWTDSEAFAQTLGGHLVTINDEAEEDFVFNRFTNNGTIGRGFWIGLNDVGNEGTFVWASGEPATFTKWGFGEPNNNLGIEDYVHIFAPFSDRAGFWNDAPDWPGLHPLPSGGGVVEIVSLQIAIDIKPGSFPNSINPKSKGTIPVAILTTGTFDATTVDPLSVKFGPSGASESHGQGHIEDVDGDGDLDLMLHFRTQDTGIQCGDTSASLTGETFSGQAIQGADSVNTVGCP